MICEKFNKVLEIVAFQMFGNKVRLSMKEECNNVCHPA